MQHNELSVPFIVTLLNFIVIIDRSFAIFPSLSYEIVVEL